VKLKRIVIPANRKRDRWVVDDLIICAHCWHEWTAVYPESIDRSMLECPKCGCRGPKCVAHSKRGSSS